MKIGRKIKDIIASALVLLGVLLMLFSFGPFTVSNDTQPVAKRVSSLVERRVVTLEHFMQEAMDGDHSSWLDSQVRTIRSNLPSPPSGRRSAT